MGLLSFFGLGGAMSPKRISQASKLACNPFAQPEVRMRELQRLLKQRTSASIAGAVRRFGANAQGHIADEEEKTWLKEALVNVGQDAQGPLEEYIRDGQKLTYALMAYEQIVGFKPALGFFLTVLTEIGPQDHQRGEQKQQLVAALLPDAHNTDVQKALAPFVADHSDDVIWAVLDGVHHALQHGAQNKAAQAVQLDDALTSSLATLLVSPHASARISRRVADLMARAAVPLGALPGPLPANLSEHYFVDGKGIVHVRASA